MAKKLLQSAELKIKIPTDLWFLLPSPPGQPAQDTVVEGSVVLFLPSTRKVKKLDVELIGRQNMFLLKRYEQYDTLRKKVTLEINDELKHGEHEFRWSFVVPANTAVRQLSSPVHMTNNLRGIPFPNALIAIRTVSHRSDFGRTYHKIKATAYGCGRLGADLVTESPELGLVNNANEPGQAAQGFSADTETTHEVLGPLRVHLFSKYFLIAGYLRLALSLPGVAEAVRIDDIAVILKQDVTLQHMQEPERIEHMKAKRVLLWSMKAEEKGTVLAAEQDFAIVRQMRLADDDTIRPSSNPLSETGIRVSHTLQTVVRFTPMTDGKLETKEMKISHECKLSSCDCMIGNLQLPSYSKEDPMTQSRQKGKGHASQCLCTIGAKEGRQEMERMYGVDPESLGAALHFGSATRGRHEAWKPDEEYGQELEEALRARSRSRSPWPGRSPATSPFTGRSPSSSRPPSRSGSLGPSAQFASYSVPTNQRDQSTSRGRDPTAGMSSMRLS